MCTGRVDISFILRALRKGADGVIVGGCWLGECHYVTEGNYYALNMMHLCKKLLEHAGIDPDRLRIEWISAAEGVRFAEIMNDFAEKLRALGPLDLDKSRDKLDEITKLVPYIKLTMKEKLAQRLDKEEDYDQLYTTEEVDKLITEVISYHIDPEKCKACLICSRHCPVDGISGGKNQIHVIDQESCIKCGSCFESCPQRFDAVQKIVGEIVPPPIPEDQRTIVRKSKSAGKSLPSD
jgi:F420-non-reducing hydrogenase iron-sulfur subunit